MQLGIDWATVDGDNNSSVQYADASTQETGSWMTGFMWKDAFIEDNTLGFAMGAPERATKIHGGHTDKAIEAFAWEAYDDYKINDKVTITPSVFGARDRTNGSTNSNDYYGGLLQTTFKF